MKSLISFYALIITLVLFSCTGTTDVPDPKDTNTQLAAPTTTKDFSSWIPDYGAAWVIHMGDNTITLLNGTKVLGTLKLNNVTYPRSLTLGWINENRVVLLTAPGVDLTLDNVRANPQKGLVMKLSKNTGATLAYKRLDAPNSNAISVKDDIWTTQMKEDGTVLILDGMDLHIKDSIKVGKFPSEITTDYYNNNQYVFVSNMGSNNLTVIDAATKKVIKTLPLGIEPGEMVSCQSAHRVAIASKKSQLVSIIDLETLSVQHPIILGFQPGVITANDNRDGIIVVNSENGAIKGYDVKQTTIRVPPPINQNGKMAFGVAPAEMFGLYVSYPLENIVIRTGVNMMGGEAKTTINVGKNPGRIFDLRYYY